jgi:hypothetical protein
MILSWQSAISYQPEDGKTARRQDGESEVVREPEPIADS